MHDEDQVPIWFFIGGLLLIYGVLIFGAGIVSWISPPPEDQRVDLYSLHADIWWGLLMTVVGLIYCVVYNPRKKRIEQSHHEWH